MYSHSLKWKSNGLKAREQHQALNKARANICPDSFAWTRNFDISGHRTEMKKLYDQRLDNIKSDKQHALGTETGETQNASSSIRPAMCSTLLPTAPNFPTNRSAVLSFLTVFIPSFDACGAELADWPCKEELDYEGDARVRTDKIHLRLLPTPRVRGNDTVAWSLKKFVEPHPLDDMRLDFKELSVFLRTHHIADLEFTDAEGTEALGADLMSLLDPVDRL